MAVPVQAAVGGAHAAPELLCVQMRPKAAQSRLLTTPCSQRTMRVPDAEHVLVVRAYGRNGADLQSLPDLEEYLEGRRYEPIFNWPEQGLVVYLVGSR